MIKQMMDIYMTMITARRNGNEIVADSLKRELDYLKTLYRETR